MPSTLIVTGSDATYFPYLKDFLRSIAEADPAADLGVLDAGLAPEQASALVDDGVRLAPVTWHDSLPRRREDADLTVAQAARPFIREAFPGYDRYVWLDADIWIQRPSGLDPFLDPSLGPMVVVPEVHAAYRASYDASRIQNQTEAYRQFFGDTAAERLGVTPCINSGAFALDADAPHWDQWAQAMGFMLEQTQGFYIEQFALNAAIYGKRLPTRVLPARYNWICSQSLPAFDPESGLLVEPEPPHDPIELVHLTSGTKRGTHTLRVLGSDPRPMSLRYDDIRQTADSPRLDPVLA